MVRGEEEAEDGGEGAKNKAKGGKRDVVVKMMN